MCLFLTACSEPSSSQQERALKISFKGEPSSLDPRKGADLLSASMHFLLFEGLTRLNPDGSITPAQAEFIEISQDRKEYIFHLRNTYWSDNTPVTAHDFAHAWKSILDPHFASANAHLLYPIQNAEEVKKGELPLDEVAIYALDNKRLKVILTEPTPYFLDLVAFCVFFPVKYRAAENHARSNYACNGPFKLEKWHPNEKILLVKNPLYWASEKIKLPAIDISIIPHDMTVLHMYEKKELDLVDMWTSPIPIEAQLRLAKQGILQPQPIAGSSVCFFNTQRFPFHNSHIRKAFSFALNRRALVENITQMQELPALQIIPPILKNGNHRCLFEDNDATRALRELELGLQELGITKKALNGIVYNYCMSERNHKIAEALQHQWYQVLGVKVELQTHDLKLHLNMLATKTFQFAQSQWFAQYNDQINFLERFKFSTNVKNYAGWENAEFRALLQASIETPCPNQRLQLFEKAEELFIEEMPLTPIYHWTSSVLSQPYVKNVQLFKMGNPDYAQMEIDLLHN